MVNKCIGFRSGKIIVVIIFGMVFLFGFLGDGLNVFGIC